VEIGRVTQNAVGRRGRSTYNMNGSTAVRPFLCSRPSLRCVLTILGFPRSDPPGSGLSRSAIQTDVQQPADFTYEPAVLNPSNSTVMSGSVQLAFFDFATFPPVIDRIRLTRSGCFRREIGAAAELSSDVIIALSFRAKPFDQRRSPHRHRTTNLGVRSSNLFGRASNHLG